MASLGDINVDALVANTGGSRSNAIESLFNEIRKNKNNSNEGISFPYHYFFSLEPQVMFNNIKSRLLPFSIESGNYELNSYIVRYGLYVPPLFRGRPIKIQGRSSWYEDSGVLSDMFLEDQRMKAVVKGYKSPIERWNDDVELRLLLNKAFEAKTISSKSLRDLIYRMWKSSSAFSPHWGRALIAYVMIPSLMQGKVPPGEYQVEDLSILNQLEGKEWLDISAGWGDRLIAAMSLNMRYTGYDPNTNLKWGHDQLIRLFGNPDMHQIIYEPFEEAVLSGTYDVVMSSPPFFDKEVYSSSKTQSYSKYPNINDWLIFFLFKALINAWSVLKVGGYLILHLGDSSSGNIEICAKTMLFIESFLPGSSWEGILPLQSEDSNMPTWVWKKTSQKDRSLWNPSIDRSMLKFFPELVPSITKLITSKRSISYSNYLTYSTNLYDDIRAVLGATSSLSVDDIRRYVDPILPFLLNDLGEEDTKSYVMALMSQLNKVK